ncbi:MAG: hypothetical protein L7F77_14305 [Candidatus Magnetominusculus sp. LBB02]|nr:hypothetical protein [Candidatus Magnetominusculus sp. LBB02]
MDEKKIIKIDILIDNPTSWFWDYAKPLGEILAKYSDNIEYYKNIRDIETGEILFLLSCDRIVKKTDLQKHRHNIVIHGSDLPQGKGWSPVSWQVESGENNIPITLFEASEGLDSGHWYIKDTIELTGYELIDEIRQKQAIKTLQMIDKYLSSYPAKANKQEGKETFFNKRTSENQKIDPTIPLSLQFNKLRVCDNERYPAHFVIDGHQYILKIYRG